MKICKQFGDHEYKIMEIPNTAKQSIEDLIENLSEGKLLYSANSAAILVSDILDILYYLNKLKNISEIPEIGKKPDYIPLNFIELSEMVGEPIYVKKEGILGRWVILNAVSKDLSGEYVYINSENKAMKIDSRNCVYRNKKGFEDAQHIG